MSSATVGTLPVTLPYDSPLDDILSSFDVHGAVVLTDFTSISTISNIQKELDTASTALAAKSDTFVKSFLLDSKLEKFLDARLSKKTTMWHGDESLTNTSRPYLSATVAFYLPSGRKAEPLHRHDDIYFFDHPLNIAVEIWELWNMGTTEMSLGSGAPDVILGSHKWGEDWDPAGHLLTSLTLPPLSCLLLHGSTIHRGGANYSSDTQRIIGASWTQGYIRQEENQYLAITKDEAMALDEPTQRLIGYKINPPFGGWYELRDPLSFLKPEEDIDKTMRDFVEREGEEIPA